MLWPCLLCTIHMYPFNTLRPRQNGRYFPDDIFKCIFLNENVWISIKISLKFVPKGLINSIPALVLIMAWRRSGDKPLSEPMIDSLPTHIYVTRPRWVNKTSPEQNGSHFAGNIFQMSSLERRYLIWFQFHWRLFPRVPLVMLQHWFRQ